MKTSIFKEAAAYLKSRRSRKSYLFAILCLAVAAGAVTALASDGCGQDYTRQNTGCLTAVYKDGSVAVTAGYGPEAGLPENVVLKVGIVTPENNPEQYAQRMEDALEVLGAAGAEKEISGKIIDIGFYLPDGTEAEPKAPVSVTVQFPDSGIMEETPTVVHFAADGTEICSTSRSESGVAFVTDSFSSYAFVGTKKLVLDGEGSAWINGLNENGNLDFGSSCTYYNTVALGDKPLEWTLPSAMTWTVSEKKITTEVDGKEVTVGTISITTDGKVTYTPDSKCPPAAYGNTDIAAYIMEAPFYVGETRNAGVEFEGIGTISFEPRDIKPFVSGGSLTQDGKEVGDTVVVGESYVYTVQFKEKGSDPQNSFSTPMYFQFPDNIESKVLTDEPLYEKGTDNQVGTYSVDENGLVTFNFNEEYLKNHSDIEVGLSFDVTVTDKNGDKVTEFPWDGNGSKTFKTDIYPEVKLEKTVGEYNPRDPGGPCIDYKVELEVTKGRVENPKLTDTMGEGLSYREDSGEVKIFDEEGHDITDTFETQPYLVPTEDGNWEVEGMPDHLSKGQKVVVTYKSDVDFKKMDGMVDKGNFAFNADNTVQFTEQIPDGKREPITDEKTVTEPFWDIRVEKSGSLVEKDENSEKVGKLDWEIDVGYGSIDVRGLTVRDTLEGDQWISEGLDLELKWKDANGTTIHTFLIPWDDPNLHYEKDEKGHITAFSYTIPDKDAKDSENNPFWQFTQSDGTTRKWTDGDYLKLEYYTEYSMVGDSGTYGNGAFTDIDGKTFGDEDSIGIGVGAISKNGEESADREYMEYSVEISVPSMTELMEMITPVDPTVDERPRPRFYIEDQLEFADIKVYDEANNSRTVRYFVNNIPENISITATFSDGSDPIQFTQNGSAEQSFRIAQYGVDYEIGGEDGKKGVREFQIWFNTQFGIEDLDYHDSFWTIDKPCTLTITYKIPTGSGLILEDTQSSGNYLETDLTVRDLLDEGRTLTNEVTVKMDGNDHNFGIKHKYTTTRPEFGVNKDAEKLNANPDTPFSNEIEYHVDFNAFTTNPETGEIGEVAIDPSSFYLEDTFDSRLEYVPGSMEVYVYDPNWRLRAQYGIESEDGKVTFENKGDTTKLTVRAEAFDKLKWNKSGESEYESLRRYMTHTEGDAKKRSAIYRFVYRLRVKDTCNTGEAMEFNNEAVVHYGDKSSPDSATVDFTPEALVKDGEPKVDDHGNQIVEYKIEVNPGAVDMVTVDSEDPLLNPGRYTLTDHMSEELLTLRSDSVKVYYIEEDKEIELERIADMTQVKPENTYYVLQETGENTFKLILPDEKYIRIKYSADVNAQHGNIVAVTNTIEMEGGTSVSDKDDADFTVQGNSGWIKGQTKMRLFKKDAKSGNYIGDAEFAFYSIVGDEGDTVNVKAKIAGKDYTFTKCQKLEPDAIKGAEIGRQEEDDGNQYYLLVETRAPGGYQKNGEPVVIVFREKTEEDPEAIKVTYDGEEYDSKIYYIVAGDNVVVIDNEPDIYSLPETGGNGPLWLYLLGSMFIMAGGLALLYDRKLARRGISR